MNLPSKPSPAQVIYEFTQASAEISDVVHDAPLNLIKNRIVPLMRELFIKHRMGEQDMRKLGNETGDLMVAIFRQASAMEEIRTTYLADASAELTHEQKILLEQFPKTLEDTAKMLRQFEQRGDEPNPGLKDVAAIADSLRVRFNECMGESKSQGRQHGG